MARSRVLEADGRVTLRGRAGAILFAVLCAVSPPCEIAAQQFSAPVEARVPRAPTLVAGSDGHRHLVYEIHLTNFYASNGPLTLTGLQVHSTARTAPLAAFDAKALAEMAKPATPPSEHGLVLAAGAREVLFVWLTVPDDVAAPVELRHRMQFVDAKGLKRDLDALAVPVARQAAVTIAPPLRGGRNWLVSEGPGNAHSHHWGSLLALNGVVTIPQRYAIDFVGLDDAGHALKPGAAMPEKSVNADWVGYGSDVLAVADGTVADARDGQPDGRPMARGGDESELTARGLFGNFVILKIAPGVFANYAHLQPGSVAVRPGQHVRRGEVIGRLGDSGNSSAPHLHFHLSDKPTFEESEGVPFRFGRFTDEGPDPVNVVLSRSSGWSARPNRNEDRLPLDGIVVRFPS